MQKNVDGVIRLAEEHKESLIKLWDYIEQIKLSGEQVIEPGQFKEKIWDSFDPAFAIKFVYNSDDMYAPMTACVAEALFAWISYPSSQRLIRQTILREIFNQLSAFSEKLKPLFPEQVMLADMAALLLFPDHAFLKETYHSIGGLEALSRAVSESVLKSDMDYESRELQAYLEVVHILHIFVDEFRDKATFQHLTLKDVCTIASRLMLSKKRNYQNKNNDERGNRVYGSMNADIFQRGWSLYKRSLAFAYASKSIIVREQNLLDVLQNRYLPYHTDDVRLLLKRSLFVARHIFSAFPRKELAHETSLLLEDIPSESFARTPRPEVDIAIRRALANLAKSSGG